MADEQVEDVLGIFQVRLAFYNLALGRGERILDGVSTTLRDETAATRAEVPPEEVPAVNNDEVLLVKNPADAEEDAPAAIAKIEDPLDEVPAVPTSPAPPEVVATEEENQMCYSTGLGSCTSST